jgi:hypothetical protein
MSEFRDKELYSAFTNLSKFILKIFDERLSSDIKESITNVGFPSLFKIFRQYLPEIKLAEEYQIFEKLLLKNQKYVKNFNGTYKIQEWIWSKTIEGFTEGLFIEYLRKNGVNFEQNLVNYYYSEIETFLIDDKIITIIKTPIIGLITDSSPIEINNDVSIVQLRGQRTIPYFGNTISVKYAYAFHDLIYRYSTEKFLDQNEEFHKIWQTKRGQIRDFLMVLRLYRRGKIGFLDSDLSYLIFHGGQTWKNFDCDLEEDWDKWDKQGYSLQVKDVENINKLWKDIHSINFKTDENQFLTIALNRFMASYEDETPEDKIVDLMICLETLLQDKLLELRFRLAIRTALLLEKDNSKRKRIYKIIKKAYDVRSGIVHGDNSLNINNVEKEAELENLAMEVEECVRKTIKEFIERLNNNEKRSAIIEKLDDELFS